MTGPAVPGTDGSPVHRCRRGLAAVGKACAMALTLMLASIPALAQQPVRIIVPYAGGGAQDILARQIAPVLSEHLKQSVIVENKPGASGTIGLAYVASAPTDGLTLMLGSPGIPAAVTQLNMPLERLDGVVPVGLIGTVGIILSANPALPVKSMKELAAYVQANAGGVDYGTSVSGPGAGYLAMELLPRQDRAKLTLVSYKGEVAAVPDLVSGRIQLMALSAPTAAPLIKSGKVRALAAVGPHRLTDYPDLPSTPEAGYPGFLLEAWFGLFLPAKTPQPVIDRLHAALTATMADAGLKGRIRAMGMEPATSGPAELGERYRAETVKWARITREAATSEAK